MAKHDYAVPHGPHRPEDFDCTDLIAHARTTRPTDPPGPYVVTKLHLSGLTVNRITALALDGLPHPETTPVGPFDTREDADAWAYDQCARHGGGSWSIRPLRAPTPLPARPAERSCPRCFIENKPCATHQPKD